MMSVDEKAEELYHHCMVCQKVTVEGVRFSYEAYVKAGGDVQALTTGLCEDRDCREEYVNFAAGGDSCLIEILRNELL